MVVILTICLCLIIMITILAYFAKSIIESDEYKDTKDIKTWYDIVNDAYNDDPSHLSGGNSDEIII